MKRGAYLGLSLILVLLVVSTFSVHGQLNGMTKGTSVQPSGDESNQRVPPSQRTDEQVREIIQAETVVNQQDLIEYEARAAQETGYITRRNVASRVRDITQTVIQVFEGRSTEQTEQTAAAIREEENKKLRDKIIDIVKTGETVRVQENLNEKEAGKLVDKGIPLKRSTATIIKRSADQPEIVHELKVFLNDLFKLSEGKVPNLLTIYPNPLDFSTCGDVSTGNSQPAQVAGITSLGTVQPVSEESTISSGEKICDLSLWVKDAYKPYTGAGDNIFTFIVANLLLPDGVTLSDDIFI